MFVQIQSSKTKTSLTLTIPAFQKIKDQSFSEIFNLQALYPLMVSQPQLRTLSLAAQCNLQESMSILIIFPKTSQELQENTINSLSDLMLLTLEHGRLLIIFNLKLMMVSVQVHIHGGILVVLLGHTWMKLKAFVVYKEPIA